MKLHFLGGAMEIGGSCIYIRISGKGILMDSGIRQSAGKDPLPDFRTIQEQGGIDAILVSHAHMDHIGTLPIISKAYPQAPIYMTAMTADLTRVLLYDSLKIMNCREDEIPHYSEQDVLSMLSRIHPVGYQTPYPVLDKFTLTFYPAGHIAGAACIYLVTEEGSLFYSGDFSAFSQRTIEGLRIPKLRPDVAIVETTYGDRLHANRQVEEKRLVELVKECIGQKHKILIPAFALGRAQEVLLILRAAIQNQEIPPVPVYVDGMVRDINIMYTRNPTYLKNTLGKRILKGNEPFYTKEIQPVSPRQKREELLSGSEPAIFLSSSGMLTGGPSAQYAKQLAASENACIIITGYQDEESPGRQLLNLCGKPEDAHLTVNGSTVPVKCRVEQVGLSAHGDKSEITSLLNRLEARRIFLVHGNREVIDALGSELAAEDYRRQIFLPECGQPYEILLHKKRVQLPSRPAYTMQMNREFTSGDEKLLWDYWQEHYPGKAFSVPQIAYIWYGRSAASPKTAPAGQNSEPGEEGEASAQALLQGMQNILMDSSYFSPNAKRLFLFEPNTQETIARMLAPKELTQQELATQITSLFSGCPYRKISYHNEQREVVLQFDYPDSLDQEDFRKRSEQFANATGWTVLVNPAMNHNAASLLLSVLFGDRLAKISYYVEKKCYSVTLTPSARNAGHAESPGNITGAGVTAKHTAEAARSTVKAEKDKKCRAEAEEDTKYRAEAEEDTKYRAETEKDTKCTAEADENAKSTAKADKTAQNMAADTDAAAAAKFRAETGWELLMNGQPSSQSLPSPSGGKTNQGDFFSPSRPVETAEQNTAFFCVDQVFECLPHKPDKKSLKQDSMGKYLDISFVSPALGCKYREQLQDLSDQTGWRIHISDKVNQHELFKSAQLVCMKYGITLTKNPSYLPETKTVQLKIREPEDKTVLESAGHEFQEITGCICTYIFHNA